jgi:nucleoside-diphosphate-sugar epimerase
LRPVEAGRPSIPAPREPDESPPAPVFSARMPAMGPTCLVTGGSGFVGRRVARFLADLGREVTVLDRSPAEGHPTVLADLGRTPIDLRREGFEHVYHVAGLAHLVPRTEEERRRFTTVNVEGTRGLLDGLERCAERPRTFVLVSTVAVYGVEAGELLDEATPRRAEDPNGLTKRQAEDLVLEWGERHGVRTAVLRLPLVWGPGAPGNLRRMVRAIAAGRYLGVGGGEARRSLVRLVDVVEALPRAEEGGGVFHLTDGHHPSFAELEAALAAAVGRRRPWRLPLLLARAAAGVGDAIEALTRRRVPFDRRALSKMTSTLTFSDERARRVLSWRPTRVLDSIADMLDEGRGGVA